MLLFEIGQEISILPLQQQLIDEAGSSMKRLRSSQEIGSLGNLLAACFRPASFCRPVLLLPLAVVSCRRPATGAESTPTHCPGTDPGPQGWSWGVCLLLRSGARGRQVLASVFWPPMDWAEPSVDGRLDYHAHCPMADLRPVAAQPGISTPWFAVLLFCRSESAVSDAALVSE